MHFYSNNPKNYVSKLTAEDTLDDFPDSLGFKSVVIQPYTNILD